MLSGQSPQAALDRALQQVNAALLDVAQGKGEDPVHHARTSVRRLRAAILVLAEKPNGRRARRAVKALRRAGQMLSAARDAEVALAKLRMAPQGPERDRVVALLERRQIMAATKVRERVQPHHTRIMKRMRGLAALRTPGKAVPRRIQALAATAVGRARALAGDPTLEGVHPLRKSLRSLRYGLEVCGLPGALQTPVLHALKNAQDTLGETLDACVASHAVEEVSHNRRGLAERLHREALHRIPAIVALASGFTGGAVAAVPPRQ